MKTKLADAELRRFGELKAAAEKAEQALITAVTAYNTTLADAAVFTGAVATSIAAAVSPLTKWDSPEEQAAYEKWMRQWTDATEGLRKVRGEKGLGEAMDLPVEFLPENY